MTRTAARRLAVQLSFAALGGTDLDTDDFFEPAYFRALPPEDNLFGEMPGEREREYIRALVNGVKEHREELDGIIARYSRGWKLGRISRTALAVLRCALYEILYREDIPDAAAVNEAVELDKSFDETETVSFINGILGSFLRERGGNAAEPQPAAEEEPAENEEPAAGEAAAEAEEPAAGETEAESEEPQPAAEP